MNMHGPFFTESLWTVSIIHLLVHGIDALLEVEGRSVSMKVSAEQIPDFRWTPALLVSIIPSSKIIQYYN